MTTMTTAAARAWAAVIGAGTLWGVGAVVADHVMARGVTPELFALARFALGVPLLWWIHLRTGIATPRLSPREWAWVIGTGAMMAVNVLSWFIAIALIGPALPTVISICGAPVLVALASVLLGYEQSGPRLVLALACAVLGVLAVAMPDEAAIAVRPDFAAGIGWSIASACCYALVVLGNARMPARLPAASASAWGMSAATVVTLAIAATGSWSIPWDGAVVAGLLYTGVVTTSIAYLAFAWGARHLPPTASVIGTLIEPVVAVALAAVLLGDTMSGLQWLGALLLAVAMLVQASRR